MGFKTSERDHLFQVKHTHHQVRYRPSRCSLIWCVCFEYWPIFVPCTSAWHTRAMATTSTQLTARARSWHGVAGTSSGWSCQCSTPSWAATPPADSLELYHLLPFNSQQEELQPSSSPPPFPLRPLQGGWRDRLISLNPVWLLTKAIPTWDSAAVVALCL